MKIEYMSSASVLIKDQDVKLLTDPWYVDGEFYGTWYNYPPCTVNLKELENIDGIYISHIHPDHFSEKTLEKMNKHIPIFIHKFHSDYLKKAIERLGFNTIEVEHDKTVNIKGDLNIRILAADNCDPSACQKYYGCGLIEKTFGSTTIDTLCAIDNGEQVIVNTNDCPFSLAEQSAMKIYDHYKHIDFLCLGYSSASAYPQCFKLSETEIKNSQKQVVQKFLEQGESYVNLFKPDFYMPFAGRYVLAGKQSNLENKRAKIELEDALDYFQNSQKINHDLHKGVILNQNSIFDLSVGESDQTYVPINKQEKQNYIENILSKKSYDYENDDNPSLDDLLPLISKSFERFEQKRKQLNFSTKTQVFISLPENKLICFSGDGLEPNIVSKESIEKSEQYLYIETDYRFLSRLLRGPQFAHWGNAETGSHLMFERKPNNYERGLFYCLNYFFK